MDNVMAVYFGHVYIISSQDLDSWWATQAGIPELIINYIIKRALTLILIFTCCLDGGRLMWRYPDFTISDPWSVPIKGVVVADTLRILFLSTRTCLVVVFDALVDITVTFILLLLLSMRTPDMLLSRIRRRLWMFRFWNVFSSLASQLCVDDSAKVQFFDDLFTTSAEFTQCQNDGILANLTVMFQSWLHYITPSASPIWQHGYQVHWALIIGMIWNNCQSQSTNSLKERNTIQEVAAT